MEKIAFDREILVESEQEVKKHLSYDIRKDFFSRLDLQEALANLRGKQRECFELVVLSGFTERQAAVQLGVSRSSVQVYLGRAKKKLKQALSETL